jgi:hypothetical protein
MTSYIIRLWAPAEATETPVWPEDVLRGTVQEISTGRSGVFVGAAQLLEFLGLATTEAEPADAHGAARA